MGREEAVEVDDGEEGGDGAEAVEGVGLEDPSDGVLTGGESAAEAREVVGVGRVAGLGGDEVGDVGCGGVVRGGGGVEGVRRAAVEVGGVLGAVEARGGGVRRRHGGGINGGATELTALGFEWVWVWV